MKLTKILVFLLHPPVATKSPVSKPNQEDLTPPQKLTRAVNQKILDNKSSSLTDRIWSFMTDPSFACINKLKGSFSSSDIQWIQLQQDLLCKRKTALLKQHQKHPIWNKKLKSVQSFITIELVSHYSH
jgi:hypothetical protein